MNNNVSFVKEQAFLHENDNNNVIKHYDKESIENLNDCSLPFETYMKEVCLVYLRTFFPERLQRHRSP